MRPVAVPASFCLAALAAVSAAGAGAATLDRALSAAAWKKHQLEFHYVGRTSRYSCEGLRDKVRAMLLDLGARRDLSVVPLGCENYRVDAGTAGFRLRIVFFSPVLADDSAKESAARTDARFERFTIASDAFRNIGLGDCELVKEFAQQLLPKLTVRDVKRDIRCILYRPSSSRFFVRGEVLRTGQTS
jgi:hypothetical protein